MFKEFLSTFISRIYKNLECIISKTQMATLGIALKACVAKMVQFRWNDLIEIFELFV